MAEKPYRVVIEGEGGRGSQVFEAETPEEMQQQFQNAQTHATKKIGEQAQEIAQLRQLAAEAQAQARNGARNQIVDVGERTNTLLSDPDAYIEKSISRRLGVNNLDEVLQSYDATRRAAAQSAINSTAAEFFEKFPEWNSLSDEDRRYNGNVLQAVVDRNGWNPSDLNDVTQAYALAQGGKLLRGLVGTVDLPIDYGFGTVSVPTTVTRPSAQVNTSESENHFLSTAPTEKVREYLEKKFQGR